MARQKDNFEDRMDRLWSGECRAQFDSRIRSLITDSVATSGPRKPESDEQVARLLSLMKDLSSRMDLLDRKSRKIAEEMRIRERRRRLSIGLVAAFMLLAIGGWVKTRIVAPATPAMAMD